MTIANTSSVAFLSLEGRLSMATATRLRCAWDMNAMRNYRVTRTAQRSRRPILNCDSAAMTLRVDDIHSSQRYRSVARASQSQRIRN
jgi:hypothetical protein